MLPDDTSGNDDDTSVDEETIVSTFKNLKRHIGEKVLSNIKKGQETQKRAYDARRNQQKV
jgi:hypothetical protein